MSMDKTKLINVVDEQGRQRYAGDEALGLFVANIAGLNNGGIEQVGEYLARQPIEVRARFIERCSSLIGTVAESAASGC